MNKVMPNIVRGGKAIGLGNNLFYMSGKKHSQGGIDIGPNDKTGLEVEGGEVVQITPKTLKVFSAQPILGGISPAQYVLGGANPTKVFDAQEYWKQVNRINDDGTQAKLGTKRDKRNFKTILNNRQEKKFQNWYKNVSSILNLDENPDNPAHNYDYRGYWLENRNKDINYTIPDFHFPDTYKTPAHETFSNESIYANKEYGIDPKTVGFWDGETFKPGDFNAILQASLAYKSPLQKKYEDSTNQYIYNLKDYEPSQAIIDYIKDVEKFSPTWYKDGNGIDTIGYGFTGSEIKKQFPNGITKEEADRVFADSLAVRAKILQKDTPNWDSLNQNQRDALLSYHYNIGEGNYRNNSPNMQQGLRDKNWEKVSENIDFGYNDKKNFGLRKRRDYERNLFNTPVEYKYGGIHIKKSKRGTFTAEAKRRGLSVQELAARILANKHRYSSAMIKKAVFARNARKWKHKEFGGEMTNNYYITPNNIYKLGGRKKAVDGTQVMIPYGTEQIPIDSTYSYLRNIYTLPLVTGQLDTARVIGTRKSMPSIVGSAVNRSGLDYIPNQSNPNFIGQVYRPNFDDNNVEEGQIVSQPATKSSTVSSPLDSPLMDRNLLMSLARLRDTNNSPKSSIPQLDSSRIAAEVASQTEAQAQRDLNSIIRNGNNYINLSTLGQLNLPTRLTTPSSTLVDTRTPKSLTNAQRLGLRISNGLRTGLNAVGNFIRENPLDVAETAINLGGNLAASLINRRAIRDLESPSAPLPLRANKLKTRININPQLDEIRETVASYEDDVTRNTASSKTALANRQNIRARGMQYANQLRGQKENIETSLINEDRMNQQNVGNQNVQLVNNWLRDVTEYNNQKRLMQAENSVAGINNAAEALSGLISGVRTNKQINMQRDRDILSAAIMAVANPNAQKVLGDASIINSIMDNIRKQFYTKK